jgi:predicted Rossmann fold flavoprotein
MAEHYKVAVIGGGASGIAAAISAKRSGYSVVICERLPKLGKKILASGNGRCNLSNDKIDAGFYNAEARELVSSIFSKFGGDDIKKFFKELGLSAYSEGGRIFPVTDQASSVLKVLETELARLSVSVETDFDVMSISRLASGFSIRSRRGRTVSCDKVILAGGGKSYPALGSNGSLYALAKEFGHNIIEPAPSAVPLIVKDMLCHLLQGQKIQAKVKSVIDDKIVSEASGDLLFAQYGLSGTAVIDISEDISIAINRNKKKDAVVLADMVPFMDKAALEEEMGRRIRAGLSGEDIIAGILPNKFGFALEELLGSRNAAKVASALKEKRFNITGTRGWNEAEFTAGGVNTAEIRSGTLESKLARGVYFAGEILDVAGRRGGYNLAWAWASGFIAGKIE